MAPPPGRAAIPRPRAAASRRASSSASVPATAAAAYSPTECPSTAPGRTPQAASCWLSAQPSATSAGWMNAVSLAQPGQRAAGRRPQPVLQINAQLGRQPRRAVVERIAKDRRVGIQPLPDARPAPPPAPETGTPPWAPPGHALRRPGYARPRPLARQLVQALAGRGRVGRHERQPVRPVAAALVAAGAYRRPGRRIRLRPDNPRYRSASAANASGLRAESVSRWGPVVGSRRSGHAPARLPGSGARWCRSSRRR